MDGWKEEALLPQKVKIEDRGERENPTDGNNNNNNNYGESK
jgi:hypothetical protein